MRSAIISLILCMLPSSALSQVFPGRAATLADLGYGTDRATSTLSSNVDNSSLTIPVASGTSFQQYNIVTIDFEKVMICSVTLTALTACSNGRGWGGTTPASHVFGTQVGVFINSTYFNGPIGEIISVENSLSNSNGDCSIGPTGVTSCAKTATVVNVKQYPFSAIGNGVADDSAAIVSACAAASSNGSILFFPPGIYRTNTITCISKSGMVVTGSGPNQSIIKSISGGNVIETSGASSTIHAISITNIGINGNGGASNYGIYFHGNTGGQFNINVDNVIVTNVGASCVSLADPGSFFENVNNVECSSTGGNGIEISGGPGRISHSYVHTVGNGKAGYICRNYCVFDSDTGLDANVNGIWAQVGWNSPLNYGYATFINCHIEFFGSIGIEILEGWISLHNTEILGNQNGTTVQALRYDSTYPYGMSEIDAQSSMAIGSGVSWLHGVAISAAATCPPIVTYNNNTVNTQSCYSEGVGGVYNNPLVTEVGVAFLFNAMQISELASPDLYVGHITSHGTAPTVSGSFPFGTGAVVNGFDASGTVTVGAMPTGTVGQIVWGATPAYRGIGVNCTVHNSKGAMSPVEQSTVNIAAISGGTSVVTQTAGSLFNTGWNTGMPVILSIGGSTGVLNNQVLSSVSSTTSLTISPGIASPTTGSTFIMPPRDISMMWLANNATLNIYSIGYAFVPGDVIGWQCTGF